MQHVTIKEFNRLAAENPRLAAENELLRTALTDRGINPASILAGTPATPAPKQLATALAPDAEAHNARMAKQPSAKPTAPTAAPKFTALDAESKAKAAIGETFDTRLSRCTKTREIFFAISDPVERSLFWKAHREALLGV